MQRLLATFMFFTRLPLWRVVNVDPSAFSRVVPLWPIAGWLTGSVMALTLWAASLVFPLCIAAALALVARLMLTGGLHDDGLADFFDGMGCGGSRERILAVMKDSHIGTYGVIALIFLYLLAVGAITAIAGSAGIGVACASVITADVWSKFCASRIVSVLPYARTADSAKNHTVYTRTQAGELLLSFLIGFVPLAVAVWLGASAWLFVAAVAPVVVSYALFMLMHKKLGGYTGDCCGATFMLCELSFLLTAAALYGLH